MYANSRIPTSAQTGIHDQLAALLDRHAGAPFRKPYADYNRAAFAASMERRARLAPAAPLILDACCGVGESSIALARAFPSHYVIGVDQSESRLARKIDGKAGDDALPANLDLVPVSVASLITQFPNTYLYGCLSADFFVGKGTKGKPGHSHNWDSAFRLADAAHSPQLMAHALDELLLATPFAGSKAVAIPAMAGNPFSADPDVVEMVRGVAQRPFW